MHDLLYVAIEKVAAVHDHLLQLNDIYGINLSDKALHFIIIGAFGLILYLFVFILFRILRDRPGVTAWLFCLVTVLLVALGIEVGQDLTGTGAMELEDLLYGVGGFAAFSLIAAALFSALASAFRPRRPSKPKGKR